jgi:hypothetical protein
MQKKSVVSGYLAVGLLLALVFGWNASFGSEYQPADQNVYQNSSSLPAANPQLSANPANLKGAYNGGASYDSGWVAITQDEAKVLTHNLGGNSGSYVVDLQFKNAGNGINQRYYGGNDFGTQITLGNPDDRVGAYWRSLTTSAITVYRRPEDTFAEQVRVRIWVDAAPDYDSGWIALAAGGPAPLITHNLLGNRDNYVVDMQFRSAGSGVNQRYYGGIDFGAKASAPDTQVGAYWYALNNTNMRVYRRVDDSYAEEVRFRIWRRPKATYDSGWIAINQDQAIDFNHAIGGNPEDYIVDMQFQSGAYGVNQRHYGGMDLTGSEDRSGAYWRTLTESTVTVYRRPEDINAPQIRIRIFNAWKIPSPTYDSGWVNITAGSDATVLSHTIGGDADSYLVDMQYKGSAADGVNNRYYGGADFGVNPAPGHNANDRVGAYWRSLTNASISVFRRAEDTYAEQTRIRIWSMPKPDYDSGWTALAKDASTALAHDLGGDPAEYLVDMQQRSAGNGVNHRHYGGADFGTQPPAGMSADDRVGAYWRSLTSTSITVYRRPEDIYAEQVRVRIWRLAKPDYDSGWVAFAVDTAQTLAHNLGGPFENYLVDMNYLDSNPGNGLNQRYFGGADFGTQPSAGYNADDRVGAYWRSLTTNSITVYRRPQDGFADSIRIRIWGIPTTNLYLPLIQRN